MKTPKEIALEMLGELSGETLRGYMKGAAADVGYLRKNKTRKKNLSNDDLVKRRVDGWTRASDKLGEDYGPDSGMMSHDELNRHYPTTIKHRGKDWHRTGKQGLRVKGDEHSAEYKNSDHYETGLDSRVWRTKSGKVHDE